MTEKIVGNLGAAIGCRILKKKNQLVFVEYSKGQISLLDLIRNAGVVSKGTVVIKGTWGLDLDTGQPQKGMDIWWEQVDKVKRKMVPMDGAAIVNLGKVNFAAITPATLQVLSYGKVPICGDDGPGNQLKDGDVFAVRTNSGNLAKVRVVKYGYDMTVEWATYKLVDPYHLIGNGYTTPEDIAVFSDEQTAYVTERTGNLLHVNLSNANHGSATLVASGMKNPQQIYLDEFHQQAYTVEYANPGRLIRINLKTNVQTVLLNGLVNAIGLLISPDLAYAYVSEQTPGGGRISRYSLSDGTRLEIASALTNPFFLTWADAAKTAMFVTERDPANKVTIVETSVHTNSVRQLVTTGFRPSSVAQLADSQILVCCDQEIDSANLLEGYTPPSGIFFGIGHVAHDMINNKGSYKGFADTTTQPTYSYQFAKNSPFGGVLPLIIQRVLAVQSGVEYYRVKVDDVPRFDTWTDLQLNMATGKYDIAVEFKPDDKEGYYKIHPLYEFFANNDQALRLNSTSLANGMRIFTIEFADKNKKLIGSPVVKSVFIDNSPCKASINMPVINGVAASTTCGMLKYTDPKDILTINYLVSRPSGNAIYDWILGRAGEGALGVPGCTINDDPVTPNIVTFTKDIAALLGPCPAAAFYAYVYVYAQSINGEYRQSQYDASSIISFALTK
jgi:hypothetical protein